MRYHCSGDSYNVTSLRRAQNHEQAKKKKKKDAFQVIFWLDGGTLICMARQVASFDLEQ